LFPSGVREILDDVVLFESFFFVVDLAFDAFVGELSSHNVTFIVLVAGHVLPLGIFSVTPSSSSV